MALRFRALLRSSHDSRRLPLTGPRAPLLTYVTSRKPRVRPRPPLPVEPGRSSEPVRSPGRSRGDVCLLPEEENMTVSALPARDRAQLTCAGVHVHRGGRPVLHDVEMNVSGRAGDAGRGRAYGRRRGRGAPRRRPGPRRGDWRRPPRRWPRDGPVPRTPTPTPWRRRGPGRLGRRPTGRRRPRRARRRRRPDPPARHALRRPAPSIWPAWVNSACGTGCGASGRSSRGGGSRSCGRPAGSRRTTACPGGSTTTARSGPRRPPPGAVPGQRRQPPAVGRPGARTGDQLPLGRGGRDAPGGGVAGGGARWLSCGASRNSVGPGPVPT